MTLQVMRGGVIVQSVALAQHTATMHVGSADRAVADGVASLDGSGDVPLAQVPDTLTGKDADTLDTKHYSDISSEIDGDIITHEGLSQNIHGAGAAETLLNSGDKDMANGIAGLDADAKIADAQMAGLNKKYIISDDVLHDNANVVSGTEYLVYTLRSAIEITSLHPTPSTLRISFKYKSNGSAVIHARIYKNGAGFGTVRETGSASWQTFVEDLEFAEGDLIQIYSYTGVSGQAVTTGYLQVQGIASQLTLQDAIDDSNCGVDVPFAGTNS